MRSPKRTTAAVLAGAVALSSAAYGIGTQVGGGSAAAEGDRANGNAAQRWQRGPAPDFGGVADELGVSASELRDALRDFHERKAGEPRDRAARSLADALGISVERVQQGLDELRDAHEKRFASRLASALGVSADRIEGALERLGDNDRPRDPRAFAEALAGELGLSAEAVHRALWSTRPGREDRRNGHPPRLPLRELAAALDVSRGDLRKAFRELQEDAQEGWKQRHEELVKFLAERFDLSTEKVERALPEPPSRGGPPAHPGPGPGPGGPPPLGP